jgi:3-methylfumaryl-CoA hydratase
MTGDDYSAWIGRTETVHDDLALTQYFAAAATFDEAPTADVATFQMGQTQSDRPVIPPLWHWFYFLPRAPQQRLGVDGHPERGGFLPPITLPRRMFAGSRLSFLAPLHAGVPARRDGEIRSVRVKEGKSGRLAFVTVGYTVWQGDVRCIEEEQDIVYREPGAPIAAPSIAPFPPPAPSAWVREVAPDARLLFRFSALTFNAHRIHYDREYAMQEEGYPGLVVHGPLNAVLIANLVRQQSTRAIASFHFRGLAPVFDLAPFRVIAHADGDAVRGEVIGPDGAVALEATIRFA